ncbi:MAG: hypothetical protein GC180_00525 [Bacteroidetes bacterium]|nr:hypothetical protein [Bacteroidota bacterium]
MKTLRKLLTPIFLLIGITAMAGEIDTLKFEVKGNCEMCKERIEEALDVRGIKSADWNVESKIIVIVYDKSMINEIRIHHLIAAAGYDTPREKASDKAYSNLPGCCHYSREQKE